MVPFSLDLKLKLGVLVFVLLGTRVMTLSTGALVSTTKLLILSNDLVPEESVTVMVQLL